MSETSHPLPPLYESELDEATVDQLFFDVAELGTPVEVLLKLAPNERAEETAPSLVGARSALRTGRARGVQLRYVHEGRAWCDTLLRLPTGTRLVRMEIPSSR